jgi:hypothetical protein
MPVRLVDLKWPNGFATIAWSYLVTFSFGLYMIDSLGKSIKLLVSLSGLS